MDRVDSGYRLPMPMVSHVVKQINWINWTWPLLSGNQPQPANISRLATFWFDHEYDFLAIELVLVTTRSSEVSRDKLENGHGIWLDNDCAHSRVLYQKVAIVVQVVIVKSKGF